MRFIFTAGRRKQPVRPTHFNGKAAVEVDLLEEIGEELIIYKGDEKEMLVIDETGIPYYFQRCEPLERGDTAYIGRITIKDCHWHYMIVRQQTGPDGLWISVDLAEKLSGDVESL